MFIGRKPPIAPSDDRLGVLTTTLPVAIATPDVSVYVSRIAAVADEWSALPWPIAEWDTTLHFFDGTERTVNWLALLDALNFCFWGDPGQSRWTVSWHDRLLNGYAALSAALSRAVQEGHPLWDADYLATLDAETLDVILRGVPAALGGPGAFGRIIPIPLFAERLAHVHELGRVLKNRFDGQFIHAIDEAKGDAVDLTLLIVETLPSFNDSADWEGHPVRLFKRAQILVSDIATAFGGRGYGAIDHLDALTAFADYKVPQQLRRLGMLEYAPDLALRIDRYEELPAGAPAEIAIRAATVWVVELLRCALARRGVAVTAPAIDYRLWDVGQQQHTDDRPYHRTRTIYY